MGEREGGLFEASFNRSIKVRQSDPRIRSNGGVLLLGRRIIGRGWASSTPAWARRCRRSHSRPTRRPCC